MYTNISRNNTYYVLRITDSYVYQFTVYIHFTDHYGYYTFHGTATVTDAVLVLRVTCYMFACYMLQLQCYSYSIPAVYTIWSNAYSYSYSYYNCYYKLQNHLNGVEIRPINQNKNRIEFSWFIILFYFLSIKHLHHLNHAV